MRKLSDVVREVRAKRLEEAALSIVFNLDALLMVIVVIAIIAVIALAVVLAVRGHRTLPPPPTTYPSTSRH